MKTKSPIQHIAMPARIIMATLLVLFAVVFVQMCIVEMAPVLWTRRPAPPAPTAEKELTAEQKRTQRIQLARKEFLPDGTLHLVTRIGGPRWQPRYTPDPPTAQEQVYDANDTLLWDGPTKDKPYDYLAWAQNVRRDDFEVRDLRRVQYAQPDISTLEFPVATGEELLEKWRYSPWQDCFVGYSLKGEMLGYLSADGITDSKSQVVPFGPFASFLAWWPPEAYSPIALWQTKRRLYQINFERQQVELIFESPDSDIADIRIGRWDSYRPKGSKATAEDRQLLHCLTRDGVNHVILRDPDRALAITTPEDWQKRWGNYCQFSATEQGLFLRRDWTEYPAPSARIDSDWRANYRKATKPQWVELYRVNSTGNLDLVNRYSWTVPGESPSASPTQYRDPRSYVKPYVTAFSPVLCDLAWAGLLRGYQGNRFAASEWMREFIEFMETIRPGYAVGSWLVMAVMLALTFLHARCRQGSKGTLIFWLVFVALLNLAGFLTYWTLNHTPIITCPACGKRRGLNQIHCVRCQAPLPAPEHGKLDLIFGA